MDGGSACAQVGRRRPATCQPHDRACSEKCNHDPGCEQSLPAGARRPLAQTRSLRRRSNARRGSRLRFAQRARQIDPHVGGALVAQLGALLQRFIDDAFELRRDARVQPDRRRGRLVDDGIGDRSRAVAREWQDARGHLIEDDAEAEEVGARVQLFAQRLLRRHVGDRSHRRPRRRQFVGSRERLSRRRLGSRLHHLGETEIQHLGLAAIGDEDIGRLDVAMDDALRVGGIERIRDLHGELQQRLGVDRLAGDGVLEGLALHQLQRDEELPLRARRFRGPCRCSDG